MKKMNWLGILGVLAVTLVACSEGSYTPTTALPQTYNQTGYVTPPYVNQFNNPALNGYQYPGQRNPNIQFYNPYLANNNQFYTSCNAQAQLQLQFRAQPMFVCQSRLNMPSFYAYTSQNNNCWLRRQPTYTPDSCACATGNCDCAKVLAQLRSQCRYTADVSVTTSSSSSGSTCSNSGSGSSCSGSGTTTTSTTTTDTNDDNIKSISPSIVKADAKEIYDRLAKEVQTVKIRAGKTYRCMMKNTGDQDSDYACAKTKNPKDTQIIDEEITGAAARAMFDRVKQKNEISSSIKTGTNFKCISDNESANDYACDYEILKSDGSILIQTPISPLAVLAFPPEAVNTPNLSIAALDQNPNHEGIIKITGPAATYIYDKETIAETTSTFNGLSATVKLGKQVKCFRTTQPSNTECQINFKSDTGEALNAS